MATHPHLEFDEQPDLIRPHMVLAWAGFNDAGEAATHGARHLITSLHAESLASIDPEEYYDFTEARPFARYQNDQRDIVWPSTDFYFVRTGGEHDLVIGLGIEPNHRWKSYMAAVLEVARSTGVEMVYTLGAVAAQVPHTRPSSVRGSANMTELAQRFDMHPSRFEGPTGIVGVFHDFCRQQDLPGISLWASVPHYLPGMTNPMGARALLEKVEELTGIELEYEQLGRDHDRFQKQADIAMQENDDLASYVAQLEDAAGAPTDEPDEGELPPAESLIEQLEDFLRNKRGDD